MKYDKRDIERVLKGTDDYHSLMRSIAISGMRHNAGYKPPNTGLLELHRNFVKWTSKKYDVSAGVWWVFYAVECGHFTPTEARKVWRYGQALQFMKNTRRKLLQITEKATEIMDIIEKTLLRMSDFIDYSDTTAPNAGSFTYEKFLNEFSQIYDMSGLPFSVFLQRKVQMYCEIIILYVYDLAIDPITDIKKFERDLIKVVR